MLLLWETQTEFQNAFFLVEHANSDAVFKSIGTVKGQGSQREPQRYSFLHRQAGAGEHFYRLRQVDFDGKEWLSPIVRAELAGRDHLRIIPNPARDYFRVQGLGTYPAVLRLRDGRGVLLKELTVLDGDRVDLSGLPAGVYWVEGIGIGVVWVKGVVKE